MRLILRHDIRRGGGRVGNRERPRRGVRGLRDARFQQRHRPLDEAEDQPFGGEGAAEHQRQFPGDVEQLTISVGIVGGVDEPPVERLEMRQRPRDIGDLARDFADLLRHRQKELRAETVRRERDRGLLLRRGLCGLRRRIGDGAQCVDHLRALLVVLQRIERPLRLIRRQRVRFVRRRNAGLSRRSAGLSKGGSGEKCDGEQDRGDELVRHEGLFKIWKIWARATPEPELRFVDASCRSGPFRRSHVSEVCQRGDILLAFARCMRD